jgi:hypothetical protein
MDKISPFANPEMQRQEYEITSKMSTAERVELVIELSDIGAELNFNYDSNEKMALADIIKFITTVLHANKIDYTIVGGVAAGALTEPRGTKDVDVVIIIKETEIDKLLDTIEKKIKIYDKIKSKKTLLSGKPAKFAWNNRQSFDLRIARYSIDINAIKNAKELDFRGTKVRVVSPEDLFIYKLERFRNIDKHDIEQLIKFYPKLDWEYIESGVNLLATEAGIPSLIDNLKEVKKWKV